MIGFFDLIEAIRQRARLGLIIGGVIAVVVIALALIQPRAYTAQSSILVDLASGDPTDDQKNNNNPTVLGTVIGTQVDLLRSSVVLTEAAQRLNLLNDAALGETPEERMQAAETALRKKLNIQSDENSNVIRLSYTDRDAGFSANAVNAIVDTFLEKQVELRVNPARSGARWFDARTKDVRERYEQAQKRLSDFQRANGIVGVDRMDMEGDKAKSLSAELVQAQAQAAEARSRAGAANDPSVAGSDIVQNLEREVGLQSGKVAELSKTLGPNHPNMLAANAQLSALRRSLGEARASQASALRSASASASRREAELRAQLERQQSQMIAASGVQDQLMVLQRDVDAARQTYDTVRQRYNEATLKSEISQANTSRLDRATAPTLPSKPNLPMWFMAAIVLGGMAGIGTIAGLELARPRVRTPSGTARLADIDIIVDMTNPNSTRSLSPRLSKEEMPA